MDLPNYFRECNRRLVDAAKANDINGVRVAQQRRE